MRYEGTMYVYRNLPPRFINREVIGANISISTIECFFVRFQLNSSTASTRFLSDDIDTFGESII